MNHEETSKESSGNMEDAPLTGECFCVSQLKTKQNKTKQTKNPNQQEELRRLGRIHVIQLDVVDDIHPGESKT